MNLLAAQKFYTALKVYPSAADLLEIYKKTVPEVRLRWIVLTDSLYWS
jgi:MAS20 protein import receptor